MSRHKYPETRKKVSTISIMRKSGQLSDDEFLACIWYRNVHERMEGFTDIVSACNIPGSGINSSLINRTLKISKLHIRSSLCNVVKILPERSKSIIDEIVIFDKSISDLRAKMKVRHHKVAALWREAVGDLLRAVNAVVPSDEMIHQLR